MSWYQSNIDKSRLNNKDLYQKSFISISKKSKLSNDTVKTAYMSKRHVTSLNDTDHSDAYDVKICLTESKTGILITVNLISGVYSFPAFSDTWKYDKKETRRAVKTYNRIVNIIEDVKAEYEDEEFSGPTLQGMVRENLRYVDIDRKKETNNRSLEAAKYNDGEMNWANSIYGGRLGLPVVNITNTGSGNINIGNS